MSHQTKKYVLKTEGKFLTVRKFKDGYFLCAEDGQYEGVTEPCVLVSKQEKDGGWEMALCFQRPDGYFSPKVDGITLKVEKVVHKTNTTFNFTESHWFKVESVNGSMQFSLQSVVVPRKSLSVDKRNRFILSGIPAPITENTVA